LAQSIWRLALLPRKKFGSTGIEVSPLGLGTVKLGRNKGVKYPQSYSIPDDRDAASLIAQANSLGINLIDTAPSYGNSEERLGGLLKRSRNQWVICTKVGEEFQNSESHFDFSPQHTRFRIERSLKRLNTDVIDIALVHSDGDDINIIKNYGTLEALDQLKTEGKIRAFGMSCKTLEGGLLAAEQSDGVMVTWNLEYSDELPVIDYCALHNKGVFIKKALASGHAASSIAKNSINKSFQMVLEHQGVSSAIIGTINPEHLAANVAEAGEILRQKT
jgi:aryl-alcohol dehydrogenase-like predicted oxidoreductase